jgi:hypothetical protein
MIQGKYFSKTLTGLSAGTDLVAELETLTSCSPIVIKKLTFIATENLTIRINGVAESTLFRDTDTLYKLSLDGNDCLISSLVIKEAVEETLFVAVVF